GFSVEGHAAQRRVRQFTEKLVIVNADDSQFFRHTDANRATGLEYFTATAVVTGHQSGRLGQAPQPVGQGFLLVLPEPIRLPKGRSVNLRLETRSLQAFAKAILAAPRPNAPAQSHEPIMPETALD